MKKLLTLTSLLVTGNSFSFWEMEFSHQCSFLKSSLVFNQDRLIHKIDSFMPEVIQIGNTFIHYHQPEIIYYDLQKVINSKSGVNIMNTRQGVFLMYNDKTIDLTTALRKYFVKSVSNDELVKKISHFANFPSPKSRKKLQLTFNRIGRINGPFPQHSFQQIEKREYELLKNTKITSVWCLNPQEILTLDKENKEIIQTMEGQMLVSAIDKNFKYVYLTIDLKRDISILMQYAS